jgi:hypothetical protein
MLPFIYRCPTTGLNIQGLFADAAAADDAETYESVSCPVCTRLHLVNRTTGRTLGDDSE